jgi:hypothetical protein
MNNSDAARSTWTIRVPALLAEFIPSSTPTDGGPPSLPIGVVYRQRVSTEREYEALLPARSEFPFSAYRPC